MSDNELLLAISDIFDKKLEPIKADMKRFSENQHRLNLIIENDIKRDIKLLSENYLPAAKRYEKATASIESLQADIGIIKKVIIEHSDKLKKLA